MDAGKLRDRILFQKRGSGVPDGYGNTTDAWADQFTVWAELQLRPGSEAVIAARLEGRQPVMARLRVSEATRQITTDWRAFDANGIAYNIRAAAPDPVDRDAVLLMMESGVAT